MNPLMMMPASRPSESDLSFTGRNPAEAAQKLEAMFSSLLIKEMRQTIGEENGFAGDPTDTVGGLFDQYMSDHLSAQGGLGVADVLRGTLLKDVAS